MRDNFNPDNYIEKVKEILGRIAVDLVYVTYNDTEAEFKLKRDLIIIMMKTMINELKELDEDNRNIVKDLLAESFPNDQHIKKPLIKERKDNVVHVNFNKKS